MPQLETPVDNTILMEIRMTRKSMIYQPGEKITGIVVFQWNGVEKIICNGISVKYHGEAHTGFTGQHKQKFSGTRPYFDHEKYCAGHKSAVGDRKMTISPGLHSYKFKFPLPKKLPASFEGPHGYVKYKIHAELKGATFPTHLPTAQAELFFTIIPDFPIASLPEASQPGEAISKEQTTLCFFCVCGHIAFGTHIPKKAYSMGEEIPITIEIDNTSGGDKINKVVVGLILVADYIGEEMRVRERHKKIHTEKKKSRHPALLVDGPGVEPKGKGTWNIPGFKVPLNIPPSGLGGNCKLIDVNYVVRVELIVANGKVWGQEIPVKIGTKEKPVKGAKGASKWTISGRRASTATTKASTATASATPSTKTSAPSTPASNRRGSTK